MTTNEFKKEHGNCKTHLIPLDPPGSRPEHEKWMLKCVDHDVNTKFTVDKSCRNPRRCMGGTCLEDYACNH